MPNRYLAEENGAIMNEHNCDLNGTSCGTNGTNCADNEDNADKREENLKRFTGSTVPATAPLTAPVYDSVHRRGNCKILCIIGRDGTPCRLRWSQGTRPTRFVIASRI